MFLFLFPKDVVVQYIQMFFFYLVFLFYFGLFIICKGLVILMSDEECLITLWEMLGLFFCCCYFIIFFKKKITPFLKCSLTGQ